MWMPDYLDACDTPLFSSVDFRRRRIRGPAVINVEVKKHPPTGIFPPKHRFCFGELTPAA